MNESENRAFFSSIESPYQAESMIRDASTAIYVVAAVQFVSALFAGKILLVGSAVNGICAFLIAKHRSAFAALLVAVLAAAGLVVAAYAHGLGTGAVIFGLLGCWAGARSLEAILKLRRGFPRVSDDDA